MKRSENRRALIADLQGTHEGICSRLFGGGERLTSNIGDCALNKTLSPSPSYMGMV